MFAPSHLTDSHHSTFADWSPCGACVRARVHGSVLNFVACACALAGQQIVATYSGEHTYVFDMQDAEDAGGLQLRTDTGSSEMGAPSFELSPSCARVYSPAAPDLALADAKRAVQSSSGSSGSSGSGGESKGDSKSSDASSASAWWWESKDGKSSAADMDTSSDDAPAASASSSSPLFFASGPRFSWSKLESAFRSDDTASSGSGSAGSAGSAGAAAAMPTAIEALKEKGNKYVGCPRSLLSRSLLSLFFDDCAAGRLLTRTGALRFRFTLPPSRPLRAGQSRSARIRLHGRGFTLVGQALILVCILLSGARTGLSTRCCTRIAPPPTSNANSMVRLRLLYVL